MNTNDPGKYNDLCTMAREAASADGAVLIIMDGNLGNGFAVQLPPSKLVLLPGLLRYMADEIHKDLVDKGLGMK